MIVEKKCYFVDLLLFLRIFFFLLFLIYTLTVLNILIYKYNVLTCLTS